MRRRIAELRLAVLGISGVELALSLSMGLVLGVFPIMGLPTVFCLVAGLRLRLNGAALQLVNQISSPLQLALLVPLARAGSWICGGMAPESVSTAGRFSLHAAHAVVGWACFVVPAGVLLYAILLALLRSRLRPRFHLLERPTA